jgi:hypothetical protein
MKQTAVNWLIDQLLIKTETTNEYILMSDKNIPALIYFAQQVEKQQIIDAWIATNNELQKIAAERYYETNFRKD